jgi:Trk K+ transport system NAD-binding subunit
LDRHWGVVIKYIDADLDLSMKSLAELDLRKKNLLVMAVERNGQVIPFPKGLEVIQSGDRLVIFGNLHSYHLLFG